MTRKTVSLNFALIFSMLISSLTIAQERIAGKLVKTGIWNGRLVEYVDGEVAIKLSVGSSSGQLSDFLNQIQARIKQDFDELRWGWIELPTGTDIMPVISTLKSMPMVEAVEPNFITRTALEPNDPYFQGTSPATYPYQWALKNTGQDPPSGADDADIDAPEAWEISTGNSNVIIAILDSGIPILNGSLSHSDLDDANKVILGPDYIDAPGTPEYIEGVRDRRGHGTHIAGIAAAESNNNTGIAGVAWNCKLMIIQVFDANGFGDFGAFYNGVKYAVDYYRNNPTTRMVINYSGGDDAPSSAALSAVEYAHSYGVILVAAVGNDTGAGVYYPAKYSSTYSNVIAVSSTNQNDTYSTFTNEGPEVSVAAPGGFGGYLDGSIVRWNGSQNTGRNIFSTTPNYAFTIQSDPNFPGDPYTSDISQNYGYMAGTSMAAPHVAGVAALILSLNSLLSPSVIRDIIQKTANDKGPAGFDETYGHGRINAYQALLLTHAYFNPNKSMSASATAANGGRKIAKTSDGKWHVVYESGITSGGAALHEIFYRNSSDGQNWSTPQRLSAGNEQNRYPSIAANGTKLYVVWQRKNDSTHDVHFASSQNSGASWSSYVLGQTNLTLDPLPVIQTGVASNFSVMVIYRSNSGGSTRLVARRTTSTNPALGNWSTETTVPGTGANDFSPTLASAQNYWGSDANFGVAYATTSGQIHYRYYQHATGGWSTTQFNLSSIVPGSNLTHKEPSLAGVGTGSTNFHVAWHRVTGSGSSPYDHAIIHRRSTGFDSWPNEYFVTYYEQQQLPALTALASNKVDLVFSLTGSNQIYKQRFNGTSWASPSFVAAGQYPSISTGNTTAKYVWTSGSAAPYTVQLSSDILSKESSEDLPVYTRSVAWLNDEGGYIELQMKPARLKLRDGSEQPLAFARATLDSFKLAPDNSWDLLQTAPKLFSIEAESLMVEYTIAASKWGSVAEPSEQPQFKIQLLDSANAELVTSVAAPLDFSANDFKTAHRLAIAVNQLTDSQELIVQMSIEYLLPKDASIASLGHIYDFTQVKSEKPQPPPASAKQRDEGFALSLRVHPNPFNPATQLRFALPSAGLVLLRIFDVNGRLVREWREEQRYAGEHVVLWDGKDEAGKDAASGIYISQIIFGGEQQMVKMTLVR